MENASHIYQTCMLFDMTVEHPPMLCGRMDKLPQMLDPSWTLPIQGNITTTDIQLILHMYI